MPRTSCPSFVLSVIVAFSRCSDLIVLLAVALSLPTRMLPQKPTSEKPDLQPPAFPCLKHFQRFLRQELENSDESACANADANVPCTYACLCVVGDVSASNGGENFLLFGGEREKNNKCLCGVSSPLSPKRSPLRPKRAQ